MHMHSVRREKKYVGRTHELVGDTRRGFRRHRLSCFVAPRSTVIYPTVTCLTVTWAPSLDNRNQPRLSNTPPVEQHAEGETVPATIPILSPCVGLTSRSPRSGTSRDGKDKKKQPQPQSKGLRGNLFKSGKAGGRTTGGGTAVVLLELLQ